MRWLLASLIVFASLIVACGDDRPAEPAELDATDSELLARVSAAIRAWPRAITGRPGEQGMADAVAYADLATAREQLDLPEDAGIPGPGGRRLLFTFAARPLFTYRTTFWPDPSLGPLGDVLDADRIETVVGTNFAIAAVGTDDAYTRDVVVVRTRQPYSEIADLLRRGAGFVAANDGLLVGGERSDGVPFPAVGDAGGGVVVFGGSPRAARAALDGAEAELTPAAELVAGLPGASRTAAGAALLGFNCVVAFGLGEEAVPREGVLAAVVDHAAEAERLRWDARTWPTTFFSNVGGFAASDGEVTFENATAERRRAEVRFTSTDDFNATRLPIEEVEWPYHCRGANR